MTLYPSRTIKLLNIVYLLTLKGGEKQRQKRLTRAKSQCVA